MKLKKPIILACCVIIAALGITLTGCSNSGSDKAAETSNAIFAESSSDMSTESGSDTTAESGTDMNAESDTDTNVENPYVGTWAATVIESSEGDVYDAKESIGVYEITLNADNTFSGLANDDVFDGNWERTEDGAKIMEPNGVSDNYTYKDGELIWEIVIGDIKATVHFVKKQ